jgi:hypothetical protein
MYYTVKTLASEVMLNRDPRSPWFKKVVDVA